MDAGVSAAMNELRPCAPISLKHVLAQELIKGLQAVSDSLLLYNTTRVLRANESGLFLSLCRAFIEVFYIFETDCDTIRITTTTKPWNWAADPHLSINYSIYWVPWNSFYYRLLILIVQHVLDVVILVEQSLLWMLRTCMMESAAY